MSEEVILEVKGIVKNFEATRALRGVDFCLKKGEIHALVGENGAGKSTLMNIVDGVFPPDAGEIFVGGKQVCIRNPHEAQELGIGFVHQEIALCPDVTVAENILMSSINNSKKITVNYKRLYEKAAEILKPLADIDPKKSVSELSVSNQQVVEIAKALSMNCKILIFDEPTSALTEQETESLFNIMRDLKQRGIGIVYISHRMAEVFGECDRVSILRDGCFMGTYKVGEIDSKTVVNKMVGREISEMYPPKSQHANQTGNILFEIRNFSDNDRFHDIGFKLREGEILGISGLVGAGRSEIAQAVCGLRANTGGEVFYRDRQVKIDSPADAIKNGIVYLTEDRKSLGLFLELALNKNISAMKIANVARYGIIDNKGEDEQASGYVKMLNIKCRNINQNASSLSGGNQQKVLIAKLLTAKPKVIFMDEPTRGIDVGAKSEIHKLLRELANQGTGIILISSELPEIIGMCDRVMVIHEGKLSGEVTAADLSEPKIIQLASGIKE
ncbi:MAG TPA: sugar ABC transporter ATP-binding protein [Bacillota bacterium]|nr:sugar ABC transporter ATP-binding protein [Bacillota bacterium]